MGEGEGRDGVSRTVPTALKRLRGTARADRATANEPKPELASADPPESLPPEAVIRWNRYAPVLIRLRVLTELDRATLADLCVVEARLAECNRELDKDGVVIAGARGGLVRHPAVMAANAYGARALQLRAKLGMSPVDRAKVSAQAEYVQDDFEAYLGATRRAFSQVGPEAEATDAE